MLQESVFIFDFDGTLYQGDAVWRLFLETVLTDVGREDLLEPAWQGATTIGSGEHGCRLGQYLPLSVPPGRLAHSSPEDYLAYLESLRSLTDAGDRPAHRLGDAWGLVFAVAEPLVSDVSVFHRSFREMRHRLVREPWRYPVSRRLRETLASLTEAHQLILFSNSGAGPDGEELLRYLEIDDLFDEIRFEAGKPLGMTERIRGLMEETNIPADRIVSIGDHPWNDLYPAHAMGAHTVLVSPYRDLDRPEWSHRVSGVDELLELLTEEWALGAA